MARRLDPFMAAMFAAIAAGMIWPAVGHVATALDHASAAAVALLFFFHGAVVAPRDIARGLTQWRLHALIFGLTFGAFPILVLPLILIPGLPEGLTTGFVYLAVLPSAVSSSIAYTAMARGNVPGAICAAAASNVLGLLLTPVLLSVFLRVSPEAGFDLLGSVRGVVIQLLAPFAAGQTARLVAPSWIARYESRLGQYDQAVIVLVIYVAFSHSMQADLWSTLPWRFLAFALAACLLLLCAIFAVAILAARGIGLSREDEIAAVFCGSKKSLASGLPLAQVLFAGAPSFGLIVLPIIIYNQVQIIAGAVVARRYAAKHVESRDKTEIANPEISMNSCEN